MKFLIGLLSIVIVSALPRANNDADDEMKKILETYNEDSIKICNQQVKASWAVQTDVGNRAKEEELTRMSLEYANFKKERYEKDFKNADPEKYNDNLIKRQLLSVKEMGTALLSDGDLRNLTETKQRMASIYNSARICPYEKRGNCDLSKEGWTLDPEIENRMAESFDYDELKYIWEEWHKASGAKMRDDYKIYVELMNKAAVANKYNDAGEMWQARYEDKEMVDSASQLLLEIMPLYDELHKYVRHQLIEIYGSKVSDSGEMIPAFLLGNMWAQTWVHLYDRIKPYKKASSIDVTSKMQELNYNEYKMFEMSDEFYMSMGLPTSNMSFNGESIITKPKDRIIACHASAWDFCDGKDFRIKMCTKINMEDFVVVHHEMGHIMYYILYKDQPLLLRGGANPAFHEAVGDTIALSVSTPKHLKKVNLLDKYEESEADSINALFKMALERVAFLPFGFLIDFWRWQVFSGAIPETDWNQQWWQLREGFQKVTPGEIRNETYFDPGAKYHVPADSQYIAYFFAHILEFQFYRSLCIEAGEYNPNAPEKSPLHQCDFFNSEAAGKKLAEGLKLGTSEHWTVALEKLTGQKEVSGKALLEYFAPLQKFLQQSNEMYDKLKDHNVVASKQCNKLVKAEYAVATDTNNQEKIKEHERMVLESARFTKEQYEKNFKNINFEEYGGETIQRQLKQLTVLGVDALEEKDLQNLTNVRNNMETIYNSAKICPFIKPNCNLETEGWTLNPEMEDVMANSNNYDELLYTWKNWRDASGKNMRNDYKVYVEIVNKAAQLNKRNDYGELWRDDYEDDKFEETVDKLWNQVEPLYNELHKYVKNKLEKQYGDRMDSKSPFIPAHLLGNMWAQTWVNLYEKIKPFSQSSNIDVSNAMQEQNYTILKMFEMSNDFYMGLGLPDNSMSYNVSRGAVIEKPKDRVITCHASAWDFCDGEDFRIKMCTKINMQDFVTVHHEMGHIQYYIQYKDLPISLRTGANPGFHEAVGDLMALSVSTPKHLEKIGLLKDYKDTKEDNINALFKTALQRVAFLPFGLLIDKWRWDVFSGKVPQDQWNKHWWNLREKYQKVTAPVERTENDFDPGAKYHVPASSQYIAYFLSRFLEFQFHRGLCIEAGKYNPNDPNSEPLHKCDIDGSTAAGEKLRKGLSLGLSRHWSEALEAMTGEKEINGNAMMEYFAPLYKYLKEENDNDGIRQKLEQYSKEASVSQNKLVKAEWAVATDTLNKKLQEDYDKAVLENANFVRDWYNKEFQNWHPDNFTDESNKRQIKLLTTLGLNALSDDQLSKLNKARSNMETVYNSAKICPFENKNCTLNEKGLTLDPEIDSVLAKSNNYDELLYTWKEWHDASGKKMRKDYSDYVELVNTAAKLNKKHDYGELWREDYEDPELEQTLECMWQDVEPLYKELHTYVKNKLAKIYKQVDKDNDLIPAHLLGNMWAQSWVNLYDRIKPFSGGSQIDVTNAMKEQNFTALKMFEMSDKFFKDLGLPPNDMSYDTKKGAIIEKPKDRVITCHASAWDFYDGEDFRIKMCTNINQEDFVTVHHEMGHINYFILYKDQPVPFRTSANPAFHEAVGDLIALSVSTPAHLQKIGLLKDYKDSEEDNINALFKMALERVAFLPFGYLIDKWRWDVFSGKVPQDQWNAHWWALREKYQKVSAPVSRSENDFDPGAKYHVPASSQYIAYFIAHILEFQLHRDLCIEAGKYNPNDEKSEPLHKCDIDGSKAAGEKLRKGLSLGFSRHWSVALEEITGKKTITGKAVREYFKPLEEYLIKVNNSASGLYTSMILIFVSSAILRFLIN